MKKLLILFFSSLLIVLLCACSEGETNVPNEGDNAADTTSAPASETPENQTPETTAKKDTGSSLTAEGKDLRQMAVQYMYDMANVKWTATVLIDYSSKARESLVYKPGETYLGMIYNNCKTGLESFKSVLDADSKYTSELSNWFEAPGNSCSTSIDHAWQTVSPTVNYGYTVDMMPFYPKSGVVGIGSIDWSGYNEKSTATSVFKTNDKDTILEAYALMKPGDALMRHLEDGGHALMVTKEPKIFRNNQGIIMPERSFLYLTDQNNLLNGKREFKSSWTVDAETSFADVYKETYLPVTVAELRDGKTEEPTFKVANKPTKKGLEGAGTIRGDITSNYNIRTFEIAIRKDSADGEAALFVSSNPYAKEVSLKDFADKLSVKDLPAGNYVLTADVTIGFGTERLIEVAFEKK